MGWAVADGGGPEAEAWPLGLAVAGGTSLSVGHIDVGN